MAKRYRALLLTLATSNDIVSFVPLPLIKIRPVKHLPEKLERSDDDNAGRERYDF